MIRQADWTMRQRAQCPICDGRAVIIPDLKDKTYSLACFGDCLAVYVLDEYKHIANRYDARGDLVKVIDKPAKARATKLDVQKVDKLPEWHNSPMEYIDNHPLEKRERTGVNSFIITPKPKAQRGHKKAKELAHIAYMLDPESGKPVKVLITKTVIGILIKQSIEKSQVIGVRKTPK